MRVAALYDVHGNLPALEAVLAEVESEDVDVVMVGGDVVWGPMPHETLALLRGLGDRVRFVRGNADREVVARDLTYAETPWCAARLDDDELAFLAALPETLTLELEGLGAALFCHASPRSDEEPITASSPDSRLAEILAGVEEGVVVFGHTHAQFEREALGKRLVNPGSVGLPLGEPGAYWALLGPEIELRHTRYDVGAAAERIRATGLPRAEEYFVRNVLEPPPLDAALRFEPSV